jgi:hypothetical protein
VSQLNHFWRLLPFNGTPVQAMSQKTHLRQTIPALPGPSEGMCTWKKEVFFLGTFLRVVCCLFGGALCVPVFVQPLFQGNPRLFKGTARNLSLWCTSLIFTPHYSSPSLLRINLHDNYVDAL